MEITACTCTHTHTHKNTHCVGGGVGVCFSVCVCLYVFFLYRPWLYPQKPIPWKEWVKWDKDEIRTLRDRRWGRTVGSLPMCPLAGKWSIMGSPVWRGKISGHRGRTSQWSLSQENRHDGMGKRAPLPVPCCSHLQTTYAMSLDLLCVLEYVATAARQDCCQGFWSRFTLFLKLKQQVTRA